MEGSPSDSKGSAPTKKSQMSKHPRVRRKVRPRDYPKRPLSAYNIFFKSERPSVLADYEKTKPDNQKVDLHEVVKEVGKRWKDLNEEERSKYEDEAEQDTERYRDELRAYQKEKTRLRLKEKKRLAALKAAEAKKAEEETSSHSTEDASVIDDRESTEAETADSGQQPSVGRAVLVPSEKRVPHSGENRPQTSATGSAQTPITEAMLLNGKNEILARHQLEQQERMQHEWAHQQGRMLAAQQEGKEVARSRLIQDLRVLEAARERTIQQLLELDAGEPPAPPAYRLVDPRWEDPAGASSIPFALRASLAGGPGSGGFGRGRYPPPHPQGVPPPPPAGGAAGYLGHYVALPPGVRGVVPDMGVYEREEAMLYPPSRELERSGGKRPGPVGAGVLPQR